MAYKHAVLSIASLVAMTFACNDSDYKASPEFADATKGATQETGGNTDVPDHGAVNDDGTFQPPVATSADQKAEAPAAKPAANTPAPVTPPSVEDKYKAMLASGKVMNTVTIEAGKSLAWGTSTANRLEVLIAVDAAGAPIVPAGVADQQIPAGTPAAPEDTKFQSGAADVATMNSSLRVCNNSGEAIYLHSGNGGPFKHGDGPIANATCVQFLAVRTAATDSATYDHADGNAPANYVYLKVTKIGPDGKIVP